MKKIQSIAKNISSLLSNEKFAIDYYQREYRWGKKHIVKMIEDLAEKFLASRKPQDPREAVEHYECYFLGSIIISSKGSTRFIIDGQQRLTSITLILVHLYRNLADHQQKQQLLNLVSSTKYGKRSFNLDIRERSACMEALLCETRFDETGQPESVINITARFRDIEDSFPDELLKDEILPSFTDWLIYNVYLVEISTYSDADAYMIFETMNDRGLSLTPTDMLKGYLLANITDSLNRAAANRVWRDRVENLLKLGKDEDTDAIKNWLRSQYAQTLRERRQGAKPCDFDIIGTEFHRWVRDHENDLPLADSQAFSRFIEEDFLFYSRQYERLRRAAETLTPGLEAVYYNAQNNFTLQYPVLLAPLRKDESDGEIDRKLRMTAAFIDILIARRIWNWKSTNYSTMQYAMQRLILGIRGKSAGDVAEILNRHLADEVTFADNDHFRLHRMNRGQIHRLLARMTDYVETRSGQESCYENYVRRSGRSGYQIEHIWANHPGQHKDEFDNSSEFEEHRNRIGGLLLLPKSVNASFGDKPYGEKLEYYYGQNLLAQSLNGKFYKHNPGFLRLLDESKLPFRPHPGFKKADLDERQELYRQIAELIWNPQTIAP